MAEVKFEIKEEIAAISQGNKGWTKQLNIVSWNGGAPKYDIRDWAPEHARMGKGLTLTEAEARAVYEALKERFGNS